MVDTAALRCKSCGAPLPPNVQGDLVRCDHCGTVQRLVDARAFLDQIMLQVNAFVRQALPAGLDAAATTSIDPIARHSIFVSNVRPRLSTEFGEYRFQAIHLLSSPLITLPFSGPTSPPPPLDPRQVFLFQAKVQSVGALAVDDESRGLVAETLGLSVALAYLLTSQAALAGTAPERYHLASGNFHEAAEALKDQEKYVAVRARCEGLCLLARAYDLFLAGKPLEARPRLADALVQLAQAQQFATANFDLAIMLQPIAQEISFTNAGNSMVDVLSLEAPAAAGSSLLSLRNLLSLLDLQHRTQDPRWQATFRESKRRESILGATLALRRAQAGQGAVKVVPTTGSLLVPFWVVEIPYSFQTGVAWRKHGVEVAEALLLSATFPLCPRALDGSDMPAVVTDVFTSMGRGGFIDRVGGSQTTISTGGPVRSLLAGAAPRPLGYARGVPPVSTADDALHLVQNYIQAAQVRDPTLGRQLRLSSPRVVDLVYVPVTPAPGSTQLVPFLSGMSPRYVGDPSQLASLSL